MATESRSLVVLALIANAVIAVVKFIAAGISGSSAMLAEGFHSVETGLSGAQTEEVIDRIEASVQRVVPVAIRIFVEMESPR